MAEGTYEYECMRAELLGVDAPDYDEFMKNRQEPEPEAAAVVDEEVDTQNLEEAELKNEYLKNMHGGLDELNSILQSTQKKITKFRQSCGSLTNLLKFRMGSQAGSTESMGGQQQCQPDAEEPQETAADADAAPDAAGAESAPSPPPRANGGSLRKGDLSRALDRQVDNLDSLCDKMEDAQYAMTHQNRQMKKFLK